MDTHDNIVPLVRRLGRDNRARWIHYASKHVTKSGLQFAHLIAFLKREVSRADCQYSESCDPSVSYTPRRVPMIAEDQAYVVEGPANRLPDLKPTWSQSCPLCRMDHQLAFCHKFQGLNVKDRVKTARRTRVCFKCLKANHSANNCRSTQNCQKCVKSHHELIHQDRQRPPSDQLVGVTQLEPQDKGQHSTTIAFGVVPITLQHQENRVTVNALIDDGANTSLISARLAQQLRLPYYTAVPIIKGVTGDTVSYKTTHPVKIGCNSNNFKMEVST